MAEGQCKDWERGGAVQVEEGYDLPLRDGDDGLYSLQG